MLFPISDDNRGITTTAYVTYFFLAINVTVFLYQMQNPDFTSGWSMIPKEITTGHDIVTPIQIETPGGKMAEIPQAPGPPIIWLTLLTSMFMHGGIGHIGGNMLYLWIFGDNVEHRFGHVLFLTFYLLSGLAGSLAQIAVNPDGVIPNLGASGAIAGVMGAYLVLYPRNKVNAVFFITIISVPAFLVLGMWGAMQFMSGLGSITGEASTTGGVAYMAHVGGFVAGLVIALVVRTTFPRRTRFGLTASICIRSDRETNLVIKSKAIPTPRATCTAKDLSFRAPNARRRRLAFFCVYVVLQISVPECGADCLDRHVMIRVSLWFEDTGF